jgi:hypothetical protein
LTLNAKTGYKIKRVSMSPPAVPVETPDLNMVFPLLPWMGIAVGFAFRFRGKRKGGMQGKGKESEGFPISRLLRNGSAMACKIYEEGKNG